MSVIHLGHVTRVGLEHLLFSKSAPRVYVPGVGVQRIGTLSAIEREDGSGRSFNVTVRLDSHEVVQVHVRVK